MGSLPTLILIRDPPRLCGRRVLFLVDEKDKPARMEPA
jgi:hypothetical protein